MSIDIKRIIAVLCITVWTFGSARSQSSSNEVIIVGQMKNVMWKGQLQGTIFLDTIANKRHLYALGPVEYLAGEILVIDGRSYKSTVVSDRTMKVEETFNLKAPFLGYANISSWTEQDLPAHIQTMPQLESYLDTITRNRSRPFLFRLSGEIGEARIHVVNLPKGTKVSSPADAHKGQVNYLVKNAPVEIVGFFSTEHKAIFTHHDTFLHMHLVTADRQMMGHLDKAAFVAGKMKLYLPQD